MSTPFLYTSGHNAPLLSEHDDQIYLALKGEKPLPEIPENPHYLAQSLYTIAERLECDYQVLRLSRYIECRPGYGDIRHDDFHAVAACVTIYAPAGEPGALDNESPKPDDELSIIETVIYNINSAAAARLADRLESGLNLHAAIERTINQCEHHDLTEAQLEQLEKEANGHIRRLEAIDRAHAHDPGSPEHKAAIAALP